jgi:hypothetical protein
MPKGEIIMAFMNGNGFNNQNNNNGEPKKKSNFRVGRLYGDDGILDVSTWNSDKGGTYAVLSIKAAIGKDPSTGTNAYEQKMASELPSVFLNVENVCALIEAMNLSKPETANLSLDCGRSKITIVGQNDSVKMTIENQKNGTRNVTFKAISVGSLKVYSFWKVLRDYLTICYKKASRVRLNMEEFGSALAGEDQSDDEIPF